MTPHETAVRIWQVLVAAAHNRQTVTSERLADLTGLSGGGLEPALSLLQRYCAANGWPPLAALVLGAPPVAPEGRNPEDGTPVPTSDAERHRVYQHDWFRLPPPTAAALEEAERPAKRPCPKCGKPGNAGATLCGYCWTRLIPQVEESPPSVPHARPGTTLAHRTVAAASSGPVTPATTGRARAKEPFDLGGEG